MLVNLPLKGFIASCGIHFFFNLTLLDISYPTFIIYPQFIFLLRQSITAKDVSKVNKDNFVFLFEYLLLQE